MNSNCEGETGIRKLTSAKVGKKNNSLTLKSGVSKMREANTRNYLHRVKKALKRC